MMISLLVFLINLILINQFRSTEFIFIASRSDNFFVSLLRHKSRQEGANI